MTSSTSRSAPRAAYIHIPFCLSKCHYCDFNSYSGMEPVFEDYVRAAITEIEREPVGADRGAGLDTVYFGGGTPTILSAVQLTSVLDTLRSCFGVAEDAEVTVEANPGTLNESKLAQLLRARFNRLSLGVQSFDNHFLARIGRAHSAQEAIEAFRSARSAGFSNIGIDLIFALPRQSLEHWGTTLDTAISLLPEHVSLYELSIEEGTRFAELCARGLLESVDEDTQADMYELAIRSLTSAGYEHYEVSNFARPGFRSRHNQAYWNNEPYYAFGAGATSCVGGTRARRVADPRAYIDAIMSGRDAVDSHEHLTGRMRMAETIILGLRMLDGIDLSRIREETSAPAQDEFRDEIAGLVNRGFVESSGTRLRVTRQGLLLLNEVSQAFL